VPVFNIVYSDCFVFVGVVLYLDPAVEPEILWILCFLGALGEKILYTLCLLSSYKIVEGYHTL